MGWMCFKGPLRCCNPVSWPATVGACWLWCSVCPSTSCNRWPVWGTDEQKACTQKTGMWWWGQNRPFWDQSSSPLLCLPKAKCVCNIWKDDHVSHGEGSCQIRTCTHLPSETKEMTLCVCVNALAPSASNLPRVWVQWSELPCSFSQHNHVSPPQGPTSRSKRLNLWHQRSFIEHLCLVLCPALLCLSYWASRWEWGLPSCVGTPELALQGCRGSAWLPAF